MSPKLFSEPYILKVKRCTKTCRSSYPVLRCTACAALIPFSGYILSAAAGLNSCLRHTFLCTHAVAMAPIPRLVPWKSWHEWDAVRVLLASPCLSEAQLGVKKVTQYLLLPDEKVNVSIRNEFSSSWQLYSRTFLFLIYVSSLALSPLSHFETPVHFFATFQVVAWQSRGRVPVAVQITADLISIQLQDPFFG